MKNSDEEMFKPNDGSVHIGAPTDIVCINGKEYDCERAQYVYPDSEELARLKRREEFREAWKRKVDLLWKI